MVEINEKECIGCGLCTMDCPASRISVREGKAVYTPKCIQCGHCVAVCPKGAVSIPEYDMADVEEYDAKTFAIAPEQFLHAVKFRRSIRNFRDQKVEKECMEEILQAGRYTATAKNRQGCRFLVIQEELETWKALLWDQVPALIEKMKEEMPRYAALFDFMHRRRIRHPEEDGLFFNTPACLMIASDNALDGGLAAANIENMAAAKGLGVLYSGYLTRIIEACPVLKEWLGIPDTPLICCMLIGYPAVRYKRTAPRKKADIVWR